MSVHKTCQFIFLSHALICASSASTVRRAVRTVCIFLSDKKTYPNWEHSPSQWNSFKRKGEKKMKVFKLFMSFTFAGRRGADCAFITSPLVHRGSGERKLQQPGCISYMTSQRILHFACVLVTHRLLRTTLSRSWTEIWKCVLLLPSSAKQMRWSVSCLWGDPLGKKRADYIFHHLVSWRLLCNQAIRGAGKCSYIKPIKTFHCHLVVVMETLTGNQRTVIGKPRQINKIDRWLPLISHFGFLNKSCSCTSACHL